jgi:ankyrin repeat protein
LLQDRAGDTNLIIASKAGHKTIVEALIKRYADVDTKVCDVTVSCRRGAIFFFLQSYN